MYDSIKHCEPSKFEQEEEKHERKFLADFMLLLLNIDCFNAIGTNLLDFHLFRGIERLI